MTDIDHAAILRQHADTRRRGHSVNPEVLRSAANEIERLRDERDEARRMVCGLDADIMEDQVEYAKHRGWDCFRKETNG